MQENMAKLSPERTGSMKLQVVKTKAETAIFEELSEVAGDLPGGAVIRKARTLGIGRFAALGLPHRRIEEWKYTDLRSMLQDAYPVALPEAAPGGAGWSAAEESLLEVPGATEIVFIDDTCVTALNENLPKGVSIESLGSLLEKEPDWFLDEIKAIGGEDGDATVALNTAMMTEGAVIRIAENTRVKAPIHLVFKAGRGVPAAVGLRNILLVEKGASVTLVESYASPAAALRQRNALTYTVIGDSAEVAHVSCVGSVRGSVHIGTVLARLGAGSSYRPFQMSIGDGLVRVDTKTTFAGEDGTFDLSSALVADGRGHADTTIVVDHAVPHCTSRELVKAVLDGNARGICQGKVIVRPDAQKTDGKQMAQSLMLSPDAEFDSKPELEIYADDVICGHGSTSAEIDEDLLFYCRSRGIPLEEARALLVESFIGEAIDKVENEELRGRLMALTREWLMTRVSGRSAG
jgi:Fe-S cluster assembly protein SufD